MKYLLDTNAVIAVLNDSHSVVATKLKSNDPRDVALSSIVVHELYYGAFKSQKREQNVELIDGLLFEILQFDREDARQAGEIRAYLTSLGSPIGPYDVLISGQAVARGLTLVTNNIREFERVLTLSVEDWSNA